MKEKNRLIASEIGDFEVSAETFIIDIFSWSNPWNFMSPVYLDVMDK